MFGDLYGRGMVMCVGFGDLYGREVMCVVFEDLYGREVMRVLFEDLYGREVISVLFEVPHGQEGMHVVFEVHEFLLLRRSLLILQLEKLNYYHLHYFIIHMSWTPAQYVIIVC